MPDYEILRPMRHDGSGKLAPGGSIELDEETARPLLNAGVIRPEREGQRLPKAEPQQEPGEPSGGIKLEEPDGEPQSEPTSSVDPRGSTEDPAQEPDAAHESNEPTDGTEDTPGSDHDATSGAVSKAAELGIDLAHVDGTGSGGRIQATDVQRYARAHGVNEGAVEGEEA